MGSLYKTDNYRKTRLYKIFGSNKDTLEETTSQDTGRQAKLLKIGEFLGAQNKLILDLEWKL